MAQDRYNPQQRNRVQPKQDQPKPDPRNYFAAERTFLAWVRSGLALMGFGFVLARFGLFLREAQALIHISAGHNSKFSVWSGTGLVLAGVAVNIFSIIQYRATIARLNRGEMISTRPSALGIAMAAGLGILGLAIAGSLLYFR